MRRIIPPEVRTFLGKPWVAGALALAGILLAILGILIGSSLDLVALRRTQEDARAGSLVNATSVALEVTENAILGEIVTIQAGAAAEGPQATADAERVTALAGTLEALRAEQARVAVNLTAIASGAATPPPVAPAMNTQKPGVRAELLELSRFQNAITARVRYTNTGDARQSVFSTVDSSLLDEETNVSYDMSHQSNPGGIILEPDESLEVWATYTISTPETPRRLTLILNDGVRFGQVEVVVKEEPE